MALVVWINLDCRDSTVGTPGKSPSSFLPLPSSLLLSVFISLLFFFFFPSLPLLFVCSSPSFTFHFLFSLFFHSLISFFLFLIYFLLLFGFSSFSPLSTKVSECGNFPPLSSFATCHLHSFLNLICFPINSSTCHLAQCEPFTQVYHIDHAMCHSPRVPCSIHMIMSCVT